MLRMGASRSQRPILQCYDAVIAAASRSPARSRASRTIEALEALGVGLTQRAQPQTVRLVSSAIEALEALGVGLTQRAQPQTL